MKSPAEIINNLIADNIKKTREIEDIKNAVKVFLIAVKNQDLTIYPNSDTTPDHIQILENLVK